MGPSVLFLIGRHDPVGAVTGRLVHRVVDLPRGLLRRLQSGRGVIPLLIRRARVLWRICGSCLGSRLLGRGRSVGRRRRFLL